MKDAGTHHHGPLAGLGAGAAAVLFAFGVLLLAWHRVAAQVTAGITVLVYVVIAAVCALLLAVLAYAFLWLRHRVRHPETLTSRHAVRAEVVEPESPQVTAARQPAAIEPPRVYLNVAPDELAAIMRHHAIPGTAGDANHRKEMTMADVKLTGKDKDGKLDKILGRGSNPKNK